MPSKDEMKLARMFKKELLVEENRMTKIYSARDKEKQIPKNKEIVFRKEGSCPG